MNPQNPPDRCRIVLVAPPGAGPQRILAALGGGDVASLILPAWDMDDAAFQKHAEAVAPAAQSEGVAVMVADDARVAMRAGADGLHFEGSKRDLEDAIARHQAKLMIGAGGAATRDEALELGEARPDYLFFGRFGYDVRPEPHPKMLKLGQWWSEMVQIPCIVQCGTDLASIVQVAGAGVDFAALSTAVFSEGIDPAEAIARANALLDEHAPRFGD